MTRTINSSFTRPKPSGAWKFTWTNHPGQHGAIHQNAVTVTASYAADMALQTTPDDGVPGGDRVVPNNVQIRAQHGEGTPHDIRLSRYAAETLIEALTDALAWDGK